MPLDGTAFNSNYPRLDEGLWLAPIASYIAARARQAEAEATARAAKQQADTLRVQLLSQLGGSPVAMCGHRVLTHTSVAAVPRNVKLNDSRVFSFDNLKAIVLPDGTHVLPGAIATVFGGRSGYSKLDIKG